MSLGVKILAKIWLLFFLITIVVIGLAFSLTLYFPIYAVSRLTGRLRAVPDEIMYQGIRFLMFVQPWYNAKVAIGVPEKGQGILYVSNHRSHLDVFVLLSRVAGIRILAKSTLFKIPFLGLMMRASRQIGVPRGRLDAWIQAMDEVKKRLSQGERVHIFPEMTRCKAGFAGVQPFAAGPFLAALQSDAMVIPMVIRGTDGVWPKGVLGLSFRRPVQVRTLSPLRARDFANAEELKSEVHKKIEQALK